MKASLIFLSCIYLTISSHSQNFTASLLRQPQIAYLGIDNLLSCTIEGLPCNLIVLSTENGVIEKIGECKFIYRPIRTSDTKIIVSKKIKNRLRKVGEFYLAVRDIPDPIATVGGLNGGQIRKASLIAQGGIGAHSFPPLSIDIDYLVTSYAVTITRKNELLFHQVVTNNSFTPTLYEAFKTLQKDDRIIFSSILVQLPDGEQKLVKPLEFIVSAT